MKPTRKQISAEPAGRQLDAWVAEFVMGWTPTTAFGGTEHELWKKDNHNACWITAFIPSTDIAAAGQVIEKLESDPREILVKIVQLGSDHHWEVVFRECLGNQHYYFAEAPTAPLAICRAALLAVLELAQD